MSKYNPLETMPSDVPPTKAARWRKLGSRAKRQARPAIELKCLECCAWSRPEAQRCEITSCALWELNRKIFSPAAPGSSAGEAEAE